MRRSVQSRAAYNQIARIVKWRQSATSRDLLGERANAARTLEIRRDDGYALCSADTIPAASDVLALTTDVVRSGVHREHEAAKAQLVTYAIPMAQLTAHSAFLRFALDPTLLSGIGRYFGVAPILTYIGVWESRQAAGAINNSQLFHCDFEDQTQMKVFVFCSDVTIGHGPLTVVSAQDSRAITDHVGYSFNKASSYRVKDEEVATVVPRERWHPLVGPPGTIALVDTTRCFHFGSRVTLPNTARLMAVFQYVTPFAFAFPLFFKASLPFAELTPLFDWSPLQRFALSGK